MKTLSVLTVTIGLGLAANATQATAGPAFHWGSDERGMSQQECLKRANFAMGETGLTVAGSDGSDVAGSGPNVTVLVTCKALGQRTFISVVAGSPDSSVAEQTRNSVRSLVMGPPS
jgi:hypothetical protein